jgi:hypothetical protein
VLKFDIKANLLAGLTHAIGKLSLADQAKVAIDPTEGVRLAVKAVKDCEEVNKKFLDAARATYEKKKAAYEEHRARLTEAVKGKSEAEVMKLTTEANGPLKEELEKIDGESTTDPDEVVTVELSDEKHAAIKSLFGASVSTWEGSAEMFVEVADAIDSAVEATK